MANSKNPSPFKYRGKWRAQVTLKNGERPFKDCTSCAEAKDWIADQLCRANTEHAPRLGGPTQACLADALEYYATVYTVNKGGAAAELNRINHYLEGAGLHALRLVVDASNGRSLERFVRPQGPKAFAAHNAQRRGTRVQTYARITLLANKRCSAIATADLRELMTDMQREGLSPSTIQKEIALLKHVFNMAANEWSWKGFGNPCHGIKLGKSEQRFVFLTESQRNALWQALHECDSPYIAQLVAIAQETTLRRKSLLAMRWDNVDLDGRIATLPSKSGQVTIPLTRTAVTILKKLPRHASGRLFPMSANAVDLAWEGARNKAGVPALQFRDNRHLGATAFARRGFSAHQLQRVLGHKTSTMAQVYVNLVQQDILDAMDRTEPTSTVYRIPALADSDATQVQNARRSARLTRAIQDKIALVEATTGNPDTLSPPPPSLPVPADALPTAHTSVQPWHLSRPEASMSAGSDAEGPGSSGKAPRERAASGVVINGNFRKKA
jgi:integrase